jgi:hypothetical protein
VNPAADPRRVLGLAGAVALMVGIFVPLMTLPSGARPNLIGGNPSDAVTLLVLAVVSIGRVVTSHYAGLWLTAGGALVLLGSSYAPVVAARDDGTVAEALSRGAPLSWGWAVLAAGAVLLVVSAILTDRGGAATAPAASEDDDEAPAETGWTVVAGPASGETRNALRGILWQMDRNRTEAEVQRLLNAAEITVATGLVAAEANQLMTRLHDAGISSRKRRDSTVPAGGHA